MPYRSKWSQSDLEQYASHRHGRRRENPRAEKATRQRHRANGLGQVSFTLLEHGLVDEVRLWVYPIILGKKGPQSPHFLNYPSEQFDFVSSRALPNGIVIVNYKCKHES
jgi:hypothetical protein